MRGDPCPRHEGARCINDHCCGDCIELAYDREKPRVDAELDRRALRKRQRKGS